jgi:toxin HigB-1
VIVSFKHKGLEKLFLSGSTAGTQPKHEKRLRVILSRLHASTSPKDMNLPGLRLHELKGKRRGTWAVNVSGNWRVTFEFEGVDVIHVNYEDYH